jgi:predicted DNA-binding transcriptional regulator AlpA
MDMEDANRKRVIRWPELKARVPYSRVHIYRLESAGKFPSRVNLGANAIGWYEDEVDSWLRNLPRRFARGSAA